MIQVRHRSYATYSRQPRQVRKEATVTGSYVCSRSPVPGLFVSTSESPALLITKIYTSFTTLFARNDFPSINKIQAPKSFASLPCVKENR
jgi:hypothetical protein